MKWGFFCCSLEDTKCDFVHIEVRFSTAIQQRIYWQLLNVELLYRPLKIFLLLNKYWVLYSLLISSIYHGSNFARLLLFYFLHSFTSSFSFYNCYHFNLSKSTEALLPSKSLASSIPKYTPLTLLSSTSCLCLLRCFFYIFSSIHFPLVVSSVTHSLHSQNHI